MNRLLLVAGLLCLSRPALGQIPRYDGPRFTMEQVATGVYAFVFDNPLEPAMDGTAVVIVNDADVLVVDTQNTPTSARRVLTAIRKLTRKPVRYVVTTHWHGDHWQGNSVYREAFPDVEFIAHPNTRADLEQLAMPTYDSTRLRDIPKMLSALERSYATGRRRDGAPLGGADSVLAARQIALLRWLVPAIREMPVIEPTMTIADSLLLYRGDRTIEIRYLRRGNTRGDLVVWLPKERILATGDLLVHPAPYAFESFIGDWIRTLEKLRSFPAGVIIPGHGAIQRDRSYLDLVIALLRTTLDQAREAVARGLDLDATRKAVDLSEIRRRFAGDDPEKARAFDRNYAEPAVERAWLEARGETGKPSEH